MSITELDVSGIKAIRGFSETHAERRRNYITASDIPAIAGLDPYRTAADVWAEKVGLAPPFEGNEATAIGTAAEPAIQTLAEAALGKKLTRSGAWQTTGHIGATLDWLVLPDRAEIVQGKVSGLVDDWEQGPPAKVLVQVHTEMLCSGTDAAIIAVLLGGMGPLKFRMFRVERDDEMTRDVAHLAEGFWTKNVLGKVQPAGGPPSLDVLRRVRRIPKSTVPIDGELVAAWQQARSERLAAEKAAKQIKEAEDAALAQILTNMGDAEAGECPAGTLTYLETQRAGYTVEPTAFRTARWKPANGDSHAK